MSRSPFPQARRGKGPATVAHPLLDRDPWTAAAAENWPFAAPIGAPRAHRAPDRSETRAAEAEWTHVI